MYSTALDITDAANDIAGEGESVDTDDLATISPYITHTVALVGGYVLAGELARASPNVFWTA